MQPQNDPNYWAELFGHLKTCWMKPFKHPSFVFYFIGIIVVIGGFGLIEPTIRYWSSAPAPDDKTAIQLNQQFVKTLISASYSYYAAIAATALVDLILTPQQRKHFLMFFVFCGLLIFSCALLAAFFVSSSANMWIAKWPSLIGYFGSLWLWWIANANNVALLDAPAPTTAATGGDANAAPSGDLSGFNS